MNTQSIAEDIKNQLSPFLEKGFTFEYFYEKGGDSSCVYVCRFRKGREYWDWRETSGEMEVHFMTYVRDEYRFPEVKQLFPQQRRLFAVKHILKKATFDEYRRFVADLLKEELAKSTTDFLGIPL